MWDETSSIAAAVATVVAGGSLWVAWKARGDARRSARASEDSAEASRRSAAAAELVAQIERQRQHADLTPRLHVAVEPWGPGSSSVRLLVRLDGPDGLDALDEVKICVRDDQEHVAMLAGGATQDELDATVWGPYRFTPRVDGADALGRRVGVFPLSRGASRPLVLEPSQAPHWFSDPSDWVRRYADDPIRLEVVCHREGYEPWRIPIDVAQPQPRFEVEVSKLPPHIRVIARNVGTRATAVRLEAPQYPGARVQADSSDVIGGGETFAAYVSHADGAPTMSGTLRWTDQRGAEHELHVDFRRVVGS